jgi:hypothetical protein
MVAYTTLLFQYFLTGNQVSSSLGRDLVPKYFARKKGSVNYSTTIYRPKLYMIYTVFRSDVNGGLT